MPMFNPPHPGELLKHDALIPLGLTVTDVMRGPLGEIVEVIVTGANDVWVLEGPLGEVLLPVIDDVVVSIDWEARTVTVSALDGLLPEEGA